jgi:hypothetical protein
MNCVDSPKLKVSQTEYLSNWELQTSVTLNLVLTMFHCLRAKNVMCCWLKCVFTVLPNEVKKHTYARYLYTKEFHLKSIHVPFSESRCVVHCRCAARRASPLYCSRIVFSEYVRKVVDTECSRRYASPSHIAVKLWPVSLRYTRTAKPLSVCDSAQENSFNSDDCLQVCDNDWYISGPPQWPSGKRTSLAFERSGTRYRPSSVAIIIIMVIIIINQYHGNQSPEDSRRINPRSVVSNIPKATENVQHNVPVILILLSIPGLFYFFNYISSHICLLQTFMKSHR